MDYEQVPSSAAAPFPELMSHPFPVPRTTDLSTGRAWRPSSSVIRLIFSSAASLIAPVLLLAPALAVSSLAQAVSREEVQAAMRRAATFYRTRVASHGGYVYYYSSDLSRRWGEGKATAEQIWVQPPGTPSVGIAYLKAHAATRDEFYLEAAREAAEALVYGQLESGGWANAIDFDPKGNLVAKYRQGRGQGRNYSSLDDGVTQAALTFLMQADRAHGFQHSAIHEAAEFARASLLAAQFPSGGFPQGWSGPVTAHPPARASYPAYDWRTENRIKNYWDMPTLNDGLAGTVAATLIEAWETYKDQRCRKALEKLGDFLLLAQMPDPQPAWAQQYDLQMRPIWARKFEPPAIAGRESQDAAETLLLIHRVTGNAKYLEPVPRALAYLKRSLLPDGQLARYYELTSNKPLYMTRDYQLTYDDSDVPQHYGWKTKSHVVKIEKALQAARTRRPPSAPKVPDAAEVRAILSALDGEGRWVSTYDGQSLVGQPRFQKGESFIASEVFSKNLTILSRYLLGQ
jgi:PelA/Pel-15E family pectate lyase